MVLLNALFAAGMGISLMFLWCVGPMSHFASLGGRLAEAGAHRLGALLLPVVTCPEAAARLSMAATIFHWVCTLGQSYAVLALLQRFSPSMGLPLSIRSIFYPIFGRRIWGWPRHIIDILAVFDPIQSGDVPRTGRRAGCRRRGYLFGITATSTSKVLLIVSITAICFAISTEGLDKGVNLSELNLGLAMLLGFIVVGPYAPV
jgi:BCCT family betaine/carnitine transporter